MNDIPSAALQATPMIDADHPGVQALAHEVSAGLHSPVERAVALYYAVRDRFRYDPYRIDLSVGGLQASRVIADGFGWCVPKAVLLVALCRASGIPARLSLVQRGMSLKEARISNEE